MASLFSSEVIVSKARAQSLPRRDELIDHQNV